jgi:hypothetical protein
LLIEYLILNGAAALAAGVMVKGYASVPESVRSSCRSG